VMWMPCLMLRLIGLSGLIGIFDFFCHGRPPQSLFFRRWKIRAIFQVIPHTKKSSIFST